MSDQAELTFGLGAATAEPAAVVVDDLPFQGYIEPGSVFVVRNYESRFLTHLFHKYPGKFIPNVPRWALRRFLGRNAGAVVLDPFVGSGTTLVEAMLDGQQGYGVDVDPLARLISKVKTTPIPADRLRTLTREIADAVASADEGKYRPAIPTLSHWFNEQAISDLSVLHAVVEGFRDEPDVYDFLLVCYSAIIRRVSNADNQTMKTYVSGTHPKQPEPARPLFVDTVSTYADRLAKFGTLVQEDRRATVLDVPNPDDVASSWSDRGLPPVDLVATSPPYIKSVDYVYNQMAELFWVGDRWGLETQAKQNAFKRRYVGNDRIAAKEAAEGRPFGIAELDDYLGRVSDQDAKLGAVMRRYFEQMGAHFSAMHAVLRPGGRYVLVIGDSTLAGITVPTHRLLMRSAEQRGFRVDYHFGYEIRNKYMRFPRGGRGGEVSHDWIITFTSEGA